MQRDAVAQLLDPIELLGRGAPHHAVDLVALVEQQLRQVGAVLPGDARDQRGAAIAHLAGSLYSAGDAPVDTRTLTPAVRARCDGGAAWSLAWAARSPAARCARAAT